MHLSHECCTKVSTNCSKYLDMFIQKYIKLHLKKKVILLHFIYFLKHTYSCLMHFTVQYFIDFIKFSNFPLYVLMFFPVLIEINILKCKIHAKKNKIISSNKSLYLKQNLKIYTKVYRSSLTGKTYVYVVWSRIR